MQQLHSLQTRVVKGILQRLAGACFQFYRLKAPGSLIWPGYAEKLHLRPTLNLEHINTMPLLELNACS